MVTAAYVYFALLALLAVGIFASEVRLEARGGRPFLVSLLIAMLRALRVPKVRTIAAVAVNCVLANGYTMITRDTDPWPYFMAIDLITASVILYQPAGRPQAIIGALYLIQIAMHAGYGIAIEKGGADPVTYWWMIAATGFLQLLFCGGWWIHDRWGRHFFRIRRQREVASSPHRARVDKT